MVTNRGDKQQKEKEGPRERVNKIGGNERLNFVPVSQEVTWACSQGQDRGVEENGNRSNEKKKK